MKDPEQAKLLWEYIEQHIDEQIRAEDLAAVYGLSFFRFCHLFTEITGQSVAAFLRRRRLELAAEDILAGDSISDVSRKRGYETMSGFCKAFRKHYGLTPTEFRTTEGGLALITPEIRHFDSFLAVGYCLAPPQGDLDILDTGAYWAGNDFSSVSKEDYARLASEGLGEVGMWMHPDSVSGEFYYFFGPIVSRADFIPGGMEPLKVPAAEYAVFAVPPAATLGGLKANVRRVWKYIFLEWLDLCAYEFDETKIDFEYYTGDGTFVCIPVKRRASAEDTDGEPR